MPELCQHALPAAGACIPSQNCQFHCFELTVHAAHQLCLMHAGVAEPAHGNLLGACLQAWLFPGDDLEADGEVDQNQTWYAVIPPSQSTVRGGPAWEPGSLVDVILEAEDSDGLFYIRAENQTIYEIS